MYRLLWLVSSANLVARGHPLRLDGDPEFSYWNDPSICVALCCGDRFSWGWKFLVFLRGRGLMVAIARSMYLAR
jgi:hypothetical protein